MVQKGITSPEVPAEWSKEDTTGLIVPVEMVRKATACLILLAETVKKRDEGACGHGRRNGRRNANLSRASEQAVRESGRAGIVG